jgi:hypothetical protein
LWPNVSFPNIFQLTVCSMAQLKNSTHHTGLCACPWLHELTADCCHCSVTFRYMEFFHRQRTIVGTINCPFCWIYVEVSKDIIWRTKCIEVKGWIYLSSNYLLSISHVPIGVDNGCAHCVGEQFKHGTHHLSL